MSQQDLTSTFIDLRDRLHKAAACILHSDTEADDALQDAFVRMWQIRDSYSDPEHRKAGLIVTVRNLCIDRLRRRRHNVGIDEAGDRTGYDASAALDHRERLDGVMEYLRSEVSEINRRVFELYVIEELEYAQIARQLGISVETARTCVSRTRKKIRDHFNNRS